MSAVGTDLFGQVVAIPVTQMCRRRPSDKARAILTYLRLNKSITLAQAAALVGRNIYHNSEKHTGAVLSRMIDRGFIVRTKPGHFALPKSS